MRVFVFGSRSVNKLTDEFKEMLLIHILNGDEFIIGDCYGVDSLVQDFLYINSYYNVTVYHIKDFPRNYNNLFKRKQIYGFKQVNKDIAMCNDCDIYLCLVKDSSKGSMRNIEQLTNSFKEGFIFNVC